MHILILPSWYPRNAKDIRGSFFREQAIALQKNGSKVGVVYPEITTLRNWRATRSEPRGITTECDEHVMTYRVSATSWVPRSAFIASKLFVRNGLKLFERYVLENGRPDVLHVHSVISAGALAIEIAKRQDIPFVVTEHSSSFARGISSTDAIDRARRAAGLAARRFAVSSEFCRLLGKLLALPDSHWEEMPNIVSNDFCERELGEINRGADYRFINIASMDENKDQATLIKAFAKTVALNPNVELVIGGGGSERGRLERLAYQLGVAGKVRFAGALSRQQVLDEVAGADAFVLSSKYETFGVVLIEALALGKPVIATRCGGPESIVREEDGLLVDVADVEAMAEAMHAMLRNRSAYDPAEIRNACVARYGETKIARRLKQIYAEVVHEHAVNAREKNAHSTSRAAA